MTEDPKTVLDPRRSQFKTKRRRVRERVLELIREMRLEPGDQIPTEHDLVKLLNVSRATLREGLNLLEQERVLQSKHGSGRFLVALPGSIAVDITKLQSVTELLNEYGIRHHNKVLEASEIPADEEVAAKLQIETGTPVISIERVRFTGDQAVIYSLDILPAQLAQTEWSAEDFSGSLLEFIAREWGIRLDFTHSTIRAITMERELAERIEVDVDVPWILLEQTNFRTDGVPLIYSLDYHRGDAIYFHVIRFRR